MNIDRHRETETETETQAGKQRQIETDIGKQKQTQAGKQTHIETGIGRQTRRQGIETKRTLKTRSEREDQESLETENPRTV